VLQDISSLDESEDNTTRAGMEQSFTDETVNNSQFKKTGKDTLRKRARRETFDFKSKLIKPKVVNEGCNIHLFGSDSES
jgi:hypothetical protein